MTRNDFARLIGYADWSELMSVSRPVVQEGEVATWYVTLMPDGIRWAAWDTAELAADRVQICETLADAVREQYEAFEEGVAEGRLRPEDWVGPDPSSFAK
jgi:hypothetical protein